MKKKILNCFIRIGICLTIICLLLFDGFSREIKMQFHQMFLRETSSYAVQKIETTKNFVKKNLTINQYVFNEMISTSNPSKVVSDSDIYTFSQGPVAWEARRVWSGQWADMSVDGNRFGAFGCGFCCMANIYCTLSDYKSSPMDVYKYAKESTYYTPSVGAAAISWKYMKQVLEEMGMEVELKNKPMELDVFQKDVKESQAMIVLVSSNEDDTFWKNTPGHYVTIWLYDEKSKSVFVGDSGDPDRNRQRISLKTVYQSLKNASEYQYLMIKDYQEEKNIWKWDQITQAWVAPD